MNDRDVVIFLDMDGVVVDWITGMKVHCKMPKNIYAPFEKKPDTLSEEALSDLFGGEEKFRKLMFTRPADFWFKLKMFPWATRLIDRLQRNFDMAFFSSPGDNPEAGKGKIQWQLKHYPDIPIILGKNKHLAASPKRFLIDDSIKKVELFREFGGFARLWPNQFAVSKLSNTAVNSLINNLITELKIRFPHK